MTDPRVSVHGSQPPPSPSADVGLRAIIGLKAFYGVLFFLVGLGVFALVNKDVSDLAEQAADSLGVDPENRYLLLLLEWLTGVSPKQIAAVGLGTILYSSLLLTMAWGLYLRRVWAEWLTIVATGFLIPIEVYELILSPRLVYALVLVINVLIVWYLVRRRVRWSSDALSLEKRHAPDAARPPVPRP